MRVLSFIIPSKVLTLTNKRLLTVFLQSHTLEHLNHLYYLTVAVLLLLTLLSLSYQLVPKEVYHDLLLDVRPPTQKVLLGRGGLLSGGGFFGRSIGLGTDSTR